MTPRHLFLWGVTWMIILTPCVAGGFAGSMVAHWLIGAIERKRHE